MIEFSRLPRFSVGAGLPAKQAPRWMARASPVFAGKPAPTGIAQDPGHARYLWERPCVAKGAQSAPSFLKRYLARRTRTRTQGPHP
ncbi:hypothetical protein CMV24_05310 [Pseudomonas plecoglossicida]|uniref:Uncharacterized protein n=1 Tax=Pseudomonas plecoglossicida TaxID=70775 RepID=A0A2A3M7W4_PSEDL|nr:hypothetical protein CMV24_05310 [Pseudomonas plecoglossicida]